MNIEDLRWQIALEIMSVSVALLLCHTLNQPDGLTVGKALLTTAVYGAFGMATSTYRERKN